MKKNIRNRHVYLDAIKEYKRSNRWYFLFLVVFSTLVILYFTANMLSMNKQAEKSAKDYADQFTNRMAASVSQEVAAKRVMLETITDSMERIPNLNDNIMLSEFLNRKKEICGFDFIAYLDMKDMTFHVIGELSDVKMLERPKELNSRQLDYIFKENRCIVTIQDSNVVHIAELKQNEERVGIVMAGNDAETMREILNEKGFEDKSRSYVIDQNGKVILASDSAGSFKNKNEIFREKEQEKLREEISHMNQDIEKKIPGIFEFRSKKNESLFLSYTPMHINDWVMITLIPSNLFAGISEKYVERALACVVGTAIAFLGFLYLALREYNSRRKSLEKMAFSDEITGGINNREFQNCFRRLCKVCDMTGYSIVLMDVNDFKEINERFGVSVGNEMLKYFYMVINRHLSRENLEFAVRSETDHFFICLREEQEEKIQKRLDDIVEDINAFHNESLPVCKICFKQGGTCIKDSETDIVVLQNQARIALKERKERNRAGCVFYNEEMAQKKDWERELEKRFETALRNFEFLPYIQPKVSIRKRCVVGGEILVRWAHPDRGFVPPLDFIPILENNGKIKKLDHYMFEQACSWLKKRKQEGKTCYPLSVNLSRVHFFEEDFLAPYLEISEKYEIDRSLIEFEMTEGIFFEENDMEKVKLGIQRMHQYGFRCAIDDFGIGYSSLSIIQKFDIDTLKLDRTFFRNLNSEKSREIIACLGELANNLHIQTVAEGIETEEQIGYLKSIGFDTIQGYYYSKPLPVTEFENWVDAFSHREV